jgi:type IV secretory pathway VirB9-like protein
MDLKRDSKYLLAVAHENASRVFTKLGAVHSRNRSHSVKTVEAFAGKRHELGRVLVAGALGLALALVPYTSVEAQGASSRTVKYSQREVIPIRAKVKFSTLIVLPENEDILDFSTGDKEFWIVNGIHNLCYIKPADSGIRTNLNLVTASGHVYSFLLTEVSKQGNAIDPDLKIFIEPKDESSIAGNGVSGGYVRASDLEAYKTQLADLRAQTAAQLADSDKQAEEKINQDRAEYPSELEFDYTFTGKAQARPFEITAIYHDKKFTYIKSDASEKPTIYEMKDGKPNLVNFDLQNGVYVVGKVLDDGYVKVGEQKLEFHRKQ